MLFMVTRCLFFSNIYHAHLEHLCILKMCVFSLNFQLLRESIKWIVVRHPFERLLSAYRDKIENSTAEPFYYDKYGKLIVMKYRKQPIIGHPEPTFEEFVLYLLNRVDLRGRLSVLDEHWTSYFAYCNPCLIDYDLIIQFETIEQDAELLIHILNSRLRQQNVTSRLIVDNLGWKHKTLSVGGRKSAERNLHSYYSQLSKTTIRKLYKMYRLDFELFAYGDASEFIAVARDG